MKVKFSGTLLLPAFTLPKLKLVGVSVDAVEKPDPLKDTVCGLLESLSVIVSVPV